MPGGRPTKITPEVQQEILERLTQGESARSICKDAHMPHWSAFCRFKRDPKNKEFLDQYALAWADGLAAWEHEIDCIAADSSRDFQPDGKGGVKSDNTAVNRDRLRVDTKKWIMSKRMPHLYGDKVQQEITGKDGAALQPVFNITVERKDG